MERKTEKIIYLINKPNWTYEEKKWVLGYLEDNATDDAELRNLMKEHFFRDRGSDDHPDVEHANLLLKRIYKRISRDIDERPINRSLLRRLSRVRLAGAAAIIGLAAFSIALLLNNNTADMALEQEVSQTDKDVITWGQKATLKLENGHTIVLDDISNGELVKSSGVIIMKTADGQIRYEVDPDQVKGGGTSALNTIATPRGGEYQVILPDGSKVWLNAASSLSFPTQFLGKREVNMEGEAYFEIARDKSRPFIVNVNEVEIRVLGTNFNVSAYKNEHETKTTLLEGSVQIKNTSLGGSQVPITMSPGQQAVVSGTQSPIQVKEVDLDDVMAWRNGYFVFHREDLRSAMNKIGRWYDLTIKFEGNLENKRFEGTVSRMENLGSLIKALELTEIANFKLEGREVTVKEK